MSKHISVPPTSQPPCASATRPHAFNSVKYILFSHSNALPPSWSASKEAYAPASTWPNAPTSSASYAPSSPPPPTRPAPPPRGDSYSSPPPPPRVDSPSSPPAPSGVSTGVIAGIATGGLIILVFLGALFIFFRKKKRRDQENIVLLSPPTPGPKDEPYGPAPQNWLHNAPPPGDHTVTVPPNPSPPPTTVLQLPRSVVHPPLTSSTERSGSGVENPRSPGMVLGFSMKIFTYEELEMATDGFSLANCLGEGGFGYVHKGVLPKGEEVAVKKLKARSMQGETEFQSEVEIISRLHHIHLVQLVGYCISGFERMLVYEFVPNHTLEFHLHGRGRPTMDWHTRLKIALGAAKGLAYLHEDCHPKIIHRDIKAANILLDLNFVAKVADFGLAKFFPDTNTHISTMVKGTLGYIAPEYVFLGKVTNKSDVFSFGIVLLELITGRRPVGSTESFAEHNSFLEWARPLLTRALEDGNFDTLVDPRLQKDYKRNEMIRMVACAAVCVRHSAQRRPQMSQVVRALEGSASLSDLNDGINPGHSTVYGSNYDAIQYNEDMKKFRKLALETTQEHGSSEYGTPAGSMLGNQQTTREMGMGKMKKQSEARGDSVELLTTDARPVYP
ncbi:Proline-rich receptor-like protein kinase [Actinidia chinensis var. chinensis]|uniref:non-specific serine/threonine protein kinase n=1 Tax=Actinidia chinensis var. chinensis TaxID=1590841 RepID=A0A2R6S1Y7_ACTCC|nr:Proline-rich receptor-like protein kinase [Actinidia chinensis var. chinensis]